MEWLSPMLGGLGIGTLLTSIINNLLERNGKKAEKLYQEKREAYLGLLKALHDAAVHPSDENSKAFAFWQARCELFGDENICKAIQGIIDTNEGPRAMRDKYFHEMLVAMKEDLRRNI